MALDRDQLGLLFKVNADTSDAVQAFQLLRGVVEGMAAETSDQLRRLGQRFETIGTQVNNSGRQFRESFGDSARSQLQGYVSQFGLFGDAVASMIPNLSGNAAAMAGVAGGLVAVGVAAGAATMKTAEYAGSLNDLKDVSNLELDTLQALKAGAGLVGESFETLTTSTVIFQKQIEAAKNGNNELRDTFTALGIDINGSVDDAFRQAIERLANMENGSAKTALAVELFGKQATTLLKIMGEMDGNFSNLIKKADEFGVLLTTEEIEAADKFGKQLDILSIKAEGLAFSIGTRLINALNALGDLSVEAFDPALAARLEQDQKNQAQAAAIARLEQVDQPITTAADVEARKKALQAQREGAKKTTTQAAKPAATRPTSTTLFGDFSDDTLQRFARLTAEQERLRIAALGDEESKLIDQAQQIEKKITQARLDQITAGADVIKQRVIELELSTLSALATQTNRQLLDVQSRRVEAEEQFEIQRQDRITQSEEKIREEAKKTFDERVRLSQALQEMMLEAERQRMEALAADPSSALSMLGPQAQEAADKGVSLFNQLKISASEALSVVSSQMGNFQTMMLDVFGSVANGLQNMLQGFLLTGKLSGQAFKQMAAQIISALASQAAVKALFNLAEGFAAAALGNAKSAASHFAAAKFYGAVAGVAAAASIGLSAIGAGGNTNSGGSFLAQDRQSGSAIVEQGARRSVEPTVIIIRAETEPGVVINKFVQDYKSNGEARSMLRRDLLGEF